MQTVRGIVRFSGAEGCRRQIDNHYAGFFQRNPLHILLKHKYALYQAIVVRLQLNQAADLIALHDYGVRS